MWLLRTDKPLKNAQLIYPTQQKDVSKIVESAKANDNVRKVIIFGSSVSNRCNPWSDIDVYYDIIERKSSLSATAEIRWTDGQITALTKNSYMSETLLDRAKSNLKAAKMNLSYKDSD